jgi:hypothetical protein
MQVTEDAVFLGTVTMRSVVLPDGCITNAKVVAGAGIVAEKLEHQHRKTFAQPNTTAAAETRAVHLVYGATGNIVAFEAGSIAACTGNATITVDLKKNGTSILTAPVTLDSANTARVAEAASVATPELADGDLLEVVVAVNAGTGALGTGVFAELVVHEDAV